MTRAAYDRIGRSYDRHRRADPRIASRVFAALSDARSIVDVGAGTGSYEPSDRRVVAVEPSRVMIGQRPIGGAPAVQGVAEALPFCDRAFDAAMAILTLHHWSDVRRGLLEMQRVARRRLVVLTWDYEVFAREFWFARDYLPEPLAEERGLAALAEVLAVIGDAAVDVVPIPHDCADGFYGAYWRRPAAYLDPEVRAGISGLARLDPEQVDPALARLERDLASGAWEERYGHLRHREEIDLGYRLVTRRLR